VLVYSTKKEEYIMKQTGQGHLWVDVEHKGADYTLTYNYGIDATVIMQTVVDDCFPVSEECPKVIYTNKFINWFHGGFDCQTELPYSDLLKDAADYIDMQLELDDLFKPNVVEEIIVDTEEAFINLQTVLKDTVDKALDNEEYKGMPELLIRMDGKTYNIPYGADIHWNLTNLIKEEMDDLF
jgi:hypothetical protein